MDAYLINVVLYMLPWIIAIPVAILVTHLLMALLRRHTNYRIIRRNLKNIRTVVVMLIIVIGSYKTFTYAPYTYKHDTIDRQEEQLMDTNTVTYMSQLANQEITVNTLEPKETIEEREARFNETVDWKSRTEE